MKRHRIRGRHVKHSIHESRQMTPVSTATNDIIPLEFRISLNLHKKCKSCMIFRRWWLFISAEMT